MRTNPRHAHAAVSFVLLGLLWLHGVFSPAPTSPSGASRADLPPAWEAAARAIAPSQLRLKPASHGPCRLEGVEASGSVRWHAVFSAFMEPRPVGYAGAVDLVAGFDDAGRITGVRILQQSETPTFAAGIDSDWFLGQFIGKTPDDPLVAGQDIDGLTHATVTVEAVCQALRQGFDVARERGSRDGSAAQSPRPAPAPRSVGPNVIALVIAVFAVLLQRFAGAAVGALLIVFALGHLSPQFVSLSHLRFLLGGSVSVQAGLILALAAAAVLVSRRGYCRFLCPCGRLQDLAHAVSPSGPGSASQPAVSDGVGRAILWAALLALPLAPDLPLERAEAFSALFLRTLGPWGAVLSISVIAGALLLPRFYCRKLCPLNPLFADIETARNALLKTISAGKAGPGGAS